MNEPAARAAVVLALGLAALGAPPPAGPAPVCTAPRPVAPEPGRPDAVHCGPIAAPGGALGGALPLLFGHPLDLNLAPVRALEVLPGIGPARAEAIARARFQRPFCSVEELERVRGIGPATVARLAPVATARCGEE